MDSGITGTIAMKCYPSILTPAQAKSLTDDEETDMLSAIVALNDDLRDYDGSPITAVLRTTSNRVRTLLLEKIKTSGWEIHLPNKEDSISRNSLIGRDPKTGSPYRQSDSVVAPYNTAEEVTVRLTERKP